MGDNAIAYNNHGNKAVCGAYEVGNECWEEGQVQKWLAEFK